ncbi:hypothetical protein CFC21_086502 [Triticum aestivum]|nr:uncharacterized protein LOC123135731 isoform X1 [Triticum aestivum]KAF7082644.1 hypothetical protein CFC21_086502 [Triticum aestivum]
MTPSFRRHRRLRPRPASAPPLEDGDLLDEILLRLSPDPSSLPRASAVCTRWRRLVSDPGFVGRFRLRHRRSPPILGCFIRDKQSPVVSFVPTMEAPNRVPAERFSLQLGGRGPITFLDCRHSLLLMFLPYWIKVLVWDPVTGDQHRLDIPPGFDTKQGIGGAVLRAAGAIRHFQVVLLGRDKQVITACVYSSEAGVWGNLVSTPLPNEVPVDFDFRGVPVLIGDSLHYLITGVCSRILEFDLNKRILTVIAGPVDILDVGSCQSTVMRAEDGGPGILFKSDCNVQLWRRKIDCDGQASWVLGRTFELDTLLSLNSEEKEPTVMLGLAEYNNAVVVQTVAGHFMVQLESLQFNKMYEASSWHFHQPFESVYTGETSIGGGGHNGAELLHNT